MPKNKEELIKRNAASQFANDTQLWQEMLNDPNQAAQAAVMERVFMLMQSGGMQISADGKTFSNPDPRIPVESYLSHGNRVLIEIPPLGKTQQNPHKLWNWLTTGNPEERDLVNHNMSTAKSSDAMRTEKPGAIFFNRSGSTHDFEVIDGHVKETKLKWYNPLNWGKFIRNKFSGTSPNWGMNIALGVKTEKDPETGKITGLDGTAGHMLFFYQPPTEKKPGVIMIGGESCEYGKTSVHGHDHNFKGHASDISNAGGLKWADKAFQRQLEQVDIKTPQKLGGIRIVADSNVETVMERYQYLGPVVKLGWPAEAKQMRQEVSKQAQTLSSTANNLSKFAELKHGVNAGLKQIKTMVKKATTIRERAMGKRLAELKDKEDDLLRTKNALADRLAEGKLPQSHEMEAFRQKLNAFSKEIKAFKKQYESLLIKSNSYAKYNAMDTTVLVVQNFIADCHKKMSAPNNEPSAELPSKKAAV